MIKVWRSQNVTDLNLYSYLEDWYEVLDINSMPWPCPFGLGVERETGKFLIQADGIYWFTSNYPLMANNIDFNFLGRFAS